LLLLHATHTLRDDAAVVMGTLQLLSVSDSASPPRRPTFFPETSACLPTRAVSPVSRLKKAFDVTSHSGMESTAGVHNPFEDRTTFGNAEGATAMDEQRFQSLYDATARPIHAYLVGVTGNKECSRRCASGNLVSLPLAPSRRHAA
jgi:hypothetical protein